MPRDLKDAAGWRFSSLRKMRLWGGGLVSDVGGGLGRLKGYVPACGFGESGGLDQWG